MDEDDFDENEDGDSDGGSEDDDDEDDDDSLDESDADPVQYNLQLWMHQLHGVPEDSYSDGRRNVSAEALTLPLDHENDSPGRAAPPRTQTVGAGSGTAPHFSAASPAAALSTPAGAPAARLGGHHVATAGSRPPPRTATSSSATLPAARAAAAMSVAAPAPYSTGSRSAPPAAAAAPAAAPAAASRPRRPIRKQYVPPTQAQNDHWGRNAPNCHCPNPSPAIYAIAGPRSSHHNRAYYRCRSALSDYHRKSQVGCDYFRPAGSYHNDAQVCFGFRSPCGVTTLVTGTPLILRCNCL